MLNPSRQKLLLRLVWLLWLIAVIVGSLLPGNTTAMRAINELHVNDKVQHYVGYALLGFLPALHERRRTLTLLLLFSAVMGVLLEVGQLYSPERSLDVFDMVADFMGIVSGSLLGVALRPGLKIPIG